MVAKPVVLLAVAATLAAAPVRFKSRTLADLVAQVPGILASQDRATGRFGSGIWICNDQNVVLPLAAAWRYRDAANPYYHSAEVLEAIMKGGDALIADQDPTGQWVFRKKDNSTWGNIYMPWTYSRWVRAFSLIKDAMPPDRRAQWEKGLLLGYNGIARQLAGERIHNIPAHHAMGLYFAGKALGNPAWREQAGQFLRRVAAAQHPDGYWSEGKGPVILYGFVYAEALGVYYAETKDPDILPVLRRNAAFHTYFNYPDGSDVETVDERNPYHTGVRVPNVGFSASPEGRTYLARQLGLRKDRVPADEAAALLLWGEEGEGAPRDPAAGDFDFVLGQGDAAVRRRGPWFLVLSAIAGPVPRDRWHQDRQNFVSVYHDRAGLILGGGNTKLQPSWSSFTAGDLGLLSHKPGDESPDFLPPAGLKHVPVSARLLPAPAFGVELDYGGGLTGTIRLVPQTPDHLDYTVSGDAALTAHVTVLPRMGQQVSCDGGQTASFGAAPFSWAAPGAWLAYAGVSITLPPGAAVRWPLLPHDPYVKDGAAQPEAGRMVVDFSAAEARTLSITVRRGPARLVSH